MLPSCLLAGYLSDQFGRKPVLIIFLLLDCLALATLLLVRGYLGYLVARFVDNACSVCGSILVSTLANTAQSLVVRLSNFLSFHRKALVSYLSFIELSMRKSQRR